VTGVFGSLSLIRNLAGDAPLTVQALQPKLTANPNFPNQTYLDWGNATVALTTNGTLQPASAKAIERVGRIGRVGIWQLFTSLVPLHPFSRVRIDGQQYAVLEIASYATHNELVVEEVQV